MRIHLSYVSIVNGKLGNGKGNQSGANIGFIAVDNVDILKYQHD